MIGPPNIKVGDFINEKFKVLKGPYKVSPDATHYSCIFECPLCKEPFERTIGNVKRKGVVGCVSCAIEHVAKSKHKYILKDKRLYRIWKNMNHRCHNPNDMNFHHYGGNGIFVCQEWRDTSVEGFNNFYKDMGIYPTNKHSIDRLDNSKGYNKENCKWSTQKEQMNNCSINRLITINNQTLTISQWAEKYNIKPNTISSRLRSGWDEEAAVITPIKK